MQPLVLTAIFNSETQTMFERLRTAHFPPARNFVPAHLTLFHALPGAECHIIQLALADACSSHPACSATLLPWRLIGRGVAREIASPGLAALRAGLASQWRIWLTEQDSKPWRPHVTIQNKVPPERARTLHAELSRTVDVRNALVVELVLWRYLGGPWEKIARFPLQAAEPSSDGAATD